MTNRVPIAFAAIGAGLIHLSLALGAPLGLAVVLAVLGFTELGWGILAFATDSTPLPRAAIGVGLTPPLLWGIALALSSIPEVRAAAASLPFIPLAIASLFGVVVAVALAVTRREPRRQRAPRRFPLVVGCVAIVALTVTAMSAVAPGQLPAHVELPPHSH
jgi:cytochrome bd-type quinol oxidase subunit 2